MKPLDLERLLSVKQVRERCLQSYSARELYRMCERGDIRAIYEQRGNRRHWSIPVSAIVEFVEKLQSNQNKLSGPSARRCIPGTQHLQASRAALNFQGGER